MGNETVKINNEICLSSRNITTKSSPGSRRLVERDIYCKDCEDICDDLLCRTSRGCSEIGDRYNIFAMLTVLEYAIYRIMIVYSMIDWKIIKPLTLDIIFACGSDKYIHFYRVFFYFSLTFQLYKSGTIVTTSADII